MKRKVFGITLAIGMALVLTFGVLVTLGAEPVSPVIIRNGGGVPRLFDGQSTGNGALFSYDVGINPGQIGIVFAYGISWNGNSVGELEIADDGTVTGGGCAIVALRPGWYPNLMILSGRYEVYDLPALNTSFWETTLITERVAEQAKHYACQEWKYEDVPWWDESTVPTAKATKVVASTTPVTPATCERKETGQGKTLEFAAGSEVYGWKIELANGFKCDGGECYIKKAPEGGEVTSGVICVNADEAIEAKKNPWDGTSNRID